MAYSYKTSIGFGLVYIPVTLHNTIKNNDIGFNMLDRKTKSRVQYKKTCVDCKDRVIKQEDIVKGFQISEDKYITFEDSELEKLKTKKDKSIVIDKFVSLNEINPIYFDKTYFVVPEKKDSEKAFCLLKEVLNKEKKVGIAKSMLGSSECVVALWVKDDDLLLSRLFFNEEVQSNPASSIKAKINSKELELAKNIIKAMEGKFDPSEYVDEYNARVKQAIKDKANGKEIKAIDQEKPIKITDLMDALQQTLKEKKSSRIVKIKKAE